MTSTSRTGIAYELTRNVVKSGRFSDGADRLPAVDYSCGARSTLVCWPGLRTVREIAAGRGGVARTASGAGAECRFAACAADVMTTVRRSCSIRPVRSAIEHGPAFIVAQAL